MVLLKNRSQYFCNESLKEANERRSVSGVPQTAGSKIPSFVQSETKPQLMFFPFVVVLALTLLLVTLSQAAVSTMPVALGGYDVVQCMLHADGTACNAKGNKVYSTQYTSVDADGEPKFTSEFMFTSQANMLAFEVSLSFPHLCSPFSAGTYIFPRLTSPPSPPLPYRTGPLTSPLALAASVPGLYPT